MQEIIQKTYEFAKKHHQNETSGHDFEHIKRVFANAQKLLTEEPNADAFTVEMSALLHDIDDRKLNAGGQDTLKFLQTTGLKKEKIEKILQTIAAIDFATSGAKPDFETLEMQLLFDADKLDAIGAIGICRVILFNAFIKRPLFDEAIFPKTNLSSAEYKNMARQENNTINHFFDKLLKIKDAMQTPSGKKEAQRRHEFMILFLRQFFAEQKLDSWQAYLDQYLTTNQ